VSDLTRIQAATTRDIRDSPAKLSGKGVQRVKDALNKATPRQRVFWMERWAADEGPFAGIGRVPQLVIGEVVGETEDGLCLDVYAFAGDEERVVPEEWTGKSVVTEFTIADGTDRVTTPQAGLGDYIRTDGGQLNAPDGRGGAGDRRGGSNQVPYESSKTCGCLGCADEPTHEIRKHGRVIVVCSDHAEGEEVVGRV
jgi:hypothetical protein